MKDTSKRGLIDLLEEIRKKEIHSFPLDLDIK